LQLKNIYFNLTHEFPVTPSKENAICSRVGGNIMM